jgi:hypothetical protein
MTVAYTGELAGDELKLSFSMKMEGAPRVQAPSWRR